jgi:hypothetical protein
MSLAALSASSSVAAFRRGGASKKGNGVVRASAARRSCVVVNANNGTLAPVKLDENVEFYQVRGAVHPFRPWRLCVTHALPPSPPPSLFARTDKRTSYPSPHKQRIRFPATFSHFETLNRKPSPLTPQQVRAVIRPWRLESVVKALNTAGIRGREEAAGAKGEGGWALLLPPELFSWPCRSFCVFPQIYNLFASHPVI